MTRKSTGTRAFLLADGREARIPTDLDHVVLQELLAQLPRESQEILLRSLEAPPPPGTPAPGPDSALSTRLGSDDPVVAAMLTRLYRRWDAAFADPANLSKHRLPLRALVIARHVDPQGGAPSAAAKHFRRPAMDPPDLVLLPRREMAPEELHQVLMQVLAVAPNSEGVAQGRDLNPSPGEVAIPHSWRDYLLAALVQLDATPPASIPVIGRVRSITLRLDAVQQA